MDTGAWHVQAGKTVDTGGRVPRTKAEKVVASLLRDLYPGYTRVSGGGVTCTYSAVID